MPGGIKLLDCVRELQSIYRMMPITDPDRVARAYLGISSITPSSTLGNRTRYVEQAYLTEVATETFRYALVAGDLPVWCDFNGAWVELDHDIMFAPNKWERRCVLHAGVYRPMNVRQEYGDDQRLACDNATLWVRESDWPNARAKMIEDRERRSGSVLRADWQQLLQEVQDHLAGRFFSVEQVGSTAESSPPLQPAVADRTGAPGRPTSKHLVLAEFERRAAAGEIEPRVKAEADVLEKWFEKQPQFEGLARIKAGSIENVIRDRYRQVTKPQK